MRWFLLGCVLAGWLQLAEMNAVKKSGCVPGDRWQDGCNRCYCSEDKKPYCTELECSKLTTEGPPRGLHCKAGTAWDSGCNKCHCTENGLAACTKKQCKGDTLESEKQCEPKSTWQNHCNACYCSDQGYAACTKVGCSPPTQVLIPLPKPQPECEAGTTWESKCYSCRCSEDGQATCTKITGCKKNTNEEPQRCKIGSLFKRKCNSCHCLNNGLVLCTLRGCDESQELLPVNDTSNESTLVSGVECASGTEWSTECHKCTCSSEGLAQCTTLACKNNVTKNSMTCKPDSEWKNDCNTCYCTVEGEAVCTRIGCNSPVIHDLNFDDSPTTDSKSNGSNMVEKVLTKRCLPGTMFYKDCNECHCDDNGDLICTKRHCLSLPSLVTDTRKKRSTCTPGDVKKQDCNVCQCPDDGSDYVCPKRMCPSEPLLEEVTDLVSELSHGRGKRAVCKANEIFQNECNNCKCNAEGTSYTCTQNECMETVNGDVEVFMENEGTDHIERHSVCEASSTFLVNCNTCVCNADGTDYGCTDDPCPLPDDVELFRELKDLGPIVPFTNCDPNQAFGIECNKCKCGEDGKDTCDETPCNPLMESLKVSF